MKLSVITINRNDAKGLERTMRSVLAQSCLDFEYIVVDGASTDGSLSVLESLLPEIEARGIVCKSLSEPDSGIYEAMNKGVRMASGEYLLMLNGGDCFVDSEVLSKMMGELDGTDFIQGNTLNIGGGRKPYRYRGYGRSEISFFDVLDGRFPHQSMFIRKAVHEKYGYYDESYRKSSDTYFFIRALGFGNASFRYVNVDVAFFYMDGITFNSEWLELGRLENERFYSENIPPRIAELYRVAPEKIRTYDRLRCNGFTWFFARVLLKLQLIKK